MDYKTYENKRRSLLDEATKHLEDSKENFSDEKLNKSIEIRKKVEDLDRQFEESKLAYANANALNELMNVDLDKISISGSEFNVLEQFGQGEEHMTNETPKIKALQQYMTNARISDADFENLSTSQLGAVIPDVVSTKLIEDRKFSDLLHRATRYNNEEGDITVPIVTGQSAFWKSELAEGEESDIEVNGLVLKGYEVMALSQISAAAHSLTAEQFENQLLTILQSSVVEKLEQSFINGTGVEQATGLGTITFTEANSVTAPGGITYEHISKALSKLPQQYSRNAIIMANNDTVYQLNKYGKEYAETLKKEIVTNEHVPSGIAYIVDPKELYVRINDLSVEADRSSSFRKGAIDLRCLCVADAKWNTKAVVKITATAE